MKVSILVPVYGVEKYIEQCATSLMEQTHDNVEFIFVDDCSSDRSVTILKEVIDRYPSRAGSVRIITHEKNQGLAAARLTALNAATGDAVMIVDSDDYVSTRAVELLVKRMRETGAKIVDGAFAVVTNGEEVYTHTPPELSDTAYLKRILCQNVEPNRIWGRLIMRSLFVDNDITFTPGIDYGEDFSVLPRLLANGSRDSIKDCVYYYRDDNSNSYTNNITTRNAISFLKSQQLVGEYFMLNKERKRRYHTAAQFGWVNVWRFARRFNIDNAIVNENFTLQPSCAFLKLTAAMFKNRSMPLWLADALYRTTRRLYLACSR